MIRLDKYQKESAFATKGPILVCAGPGSGKTRTLIARILFLLNKKVNHKKIFVLTFTNKAGEEIKKRIQNISKNGKLPYIGTIHSLCFSLLKKDKDFSRYTVISDYEQIDILKNIKKKYKLKGRIKTALTEIGKYYFTQSISKGYEDYYNHYIEFLNSNYLIDYTLILKRFLLILKNDAKFKNSLQNKFLHILVDEFQDIDPIQSEIINILSKPQNDLFAIGDADQSIYSFRGADINNFLMFHKTYPNSCILKLNNNYRSTHTIVEASKSFINNNSKRVDIKSKSISKEKLKIKVVSCISDKDEAKFISTEIERIIGGTTLLHTNMDHNLEENLNTNFSNFAVLYRTNSFSHFIEQELIYKGIPYQVIGKNPFWQKQFVIDFLNTLKYIQSRKSFYLKNLVKTSLPINKIKNIKPNNYIKIIKVLRNEDLSSAYSNYEADFQVLKKHLLDSNNLDELLRRINFLSRETQIDKKANCVKLLTIHQSKGLEFQNVFIAGLEEGFFPLIKNKRVTNIEEERRIFYVGITRPIKRLYLTYAKNRRNWSKTSKRKPSRFVNEIDKYFLDQTHFGKEIKKKSQTKMF